MASYMVSTHTNGNITQAVNQMQFMYQNTPFPVIVKKKSRPTKRLKLDQSSKNDNSFQMWVSTYKQTEISSFVENKEENLLDSIYEMNKGFLNNLGDSLFKQYLNYFHNSTKDTMESISECMGYISCSDLNRPEDEDDSLYESENSSRWSEDDTNFIVGVYSGIKIISGRKKNDWVVKRTKKKRFSYP